MNEAVRYINQEHNEKRFNRKHIDGYIRAEMTGHPVMQEVIQEGVAMVRAYIDKAVAGEYYDSKNVRVMQLHNMDLETLVTDIFVGISYCIKDELFTSVTAQMASRLRFSDKVEAITTVAELLAVLCETNVFDIRKPTKMASLSVISRLTPSEKLLAFIENSRYLPPMVCEPLELTTNFCSGYLTHNDSLILGSGNHHDGDICLDVLNKMNKVELSLNLEFLCKIEEVQVKPAETYEQMEQWKIFKQQSYQFYDLIQSQGNRFHLTHKVDKRGRAYSQGYHINTQGTAFKKAMCDLAKKEHIEVPEEYRT